MAHFTIIGAGNMANAIGGVLADGGSSVSYLSHDQVGSAALEGDVVVLAVPHPPALHLSPPGASEIGRCVRARLPLEQSIRCLLLRRK